MALFDALTHLFQPRQSALADGPSSAGSGNVYASMAAAPTAGAIAPPSPPVVAEPESETVVEVEEGRGPTEREKQAMLHLSNVSHALNHFQNQMLAIMIPTIMADLGMSYLSVGVMTGVRSVFGSLSQGFYGFVTPFVSRCKLLGLANFGIALGTLLSGLAFSFPMLIVARVVAGIGSSAQHPVGYSILASYFPKARAAVMAMNTSASNIGTLIATPLATVLLLVMDWRQIFLIVAFLSLIMGVVYLLFRDYGAPNRTGTRADRMRQGFRSYGRVLKNRNMMIIALVFMVGAAGAEGGINHTYFAPHLANDFGYGVILVGVMLTAINLGQIFGPIFFGWLSDRLNSRVMVLQASLALSAIMTLWVAWLGPGELLMFVSLVIYSAVTSSRGTLTQTIVADTASDEDRDAAFSLYFLLGFFAQPFWLLLTGFLMDTSGFGVAVSRLAISYVVAIVLLTFVKDMRRTEAAVA
jgi:MFS transporter, FSR family, fosmidomycin resistance protein